MVLQNRKKALEPAVPSLMPICVLFLQESRKEVKCRIVYVLRVRKRNKMLFVVELRKATKQARKAIKKKNTKYRESASFKIIVEHVKENVVPDVLAIPTY